MTYPSELAMTNLVNLKSYLDPSPANGIASAVVDAGGHSYTTATATVVDSFSLGTGAVLGTPVIVGGVIVSIPIVNKGREYLDPQIVIVGDGAGAAAHATIGADVTLSMLIKAVSAKMTQGTNRKAIFDSGSDRTEWHNGSGKGYMIPDVLPINSVSAVMIGTTTLSLSVNDSLGFRFTDDVVYAVGCIFPKGIQNVGLVYRSGFAAGSIEANDLELGCITTVAMQWAKRSKLTYMSESVPVGLGTHTYIITDLSKEAQSAIANIKKVAPNLQ